MNNRYASNSTIAWPWMQRCLIAIALVLLFCNDLQGEPEHKPVAPISPSELLKLLPAPPKGWKMTVSNARNSFSTWLTTMAMREFEYTPPPQPGSDPDAPQNLPQRTRYIISDGGYAPPSGSAFIDFKIGKEQGIEKLMMIGVPAMRFDPKPGEPERLMLWIKNRFLVTIEITNQEPTKIELWAKQINFQALAAVAGSNMGPLGNPLTITRVDEINKDANRSYELYWSYANE